MCSIPIEVLSDRNLQYSYVFDYIKENDNIILNKDILILLQDLGYIWKWDENTQKISNIKKGNFDNIFVLKIENVIEETMDIETETTHSYIANTLISHNTINLPKDCIQEEISEVFLEAHKRGIIGVTIYRDGSREGILIHDNEKEKKIVERHAPKRPAELQCHIYRISVKGEKWIVFIGLYEGTPYEIFAGKVKLADIPSFINEGTLIKSGDCVYQFKYQDEILISDISKLFECGEQESITRLISTSLRHGVPIKYIQQQLSKSYGNITDFNKSILRAFKKYLKDEETGEICEVCGSKIIYIEGCKKCSNPECFWSKCG